MQHLRDLNSGSGESYFVEAPSKQQAKGKTKIKLEDALRETSLDDHGGRPPSYQDQQDIPDDLAGFQPDMDPGLREVLEALEDEAYVDDEEEGDIFKDIVSAETAGDGNPIEDGTIQDEDDEGWETDDTTKPVKDFSTTISDDINSLSAPISSNDIQMSDSILTCPVPPSSTEETGAFLKSLSTEPLSSTTNTMPSKPLPPPSSIMSSSSFLPGNPSKRKRRKGALTSPSSNYSMTSGSLARTEGQSILDARFERILEDYAPDAEDGDLDDDADDCVSMMSGVTNTSHLSNISKASKTSSRLSNLSRLSNVSRNSGVSEAPSLVPMRSDFNGIMDDFLDNYSMAGRKRVRKGGNQTGMQQLDEVRKGLGPARVKVDR